MATLNVYQFYMYHPQSGPFLPGTSRSFSSQWTWQGKAVALSAHPFDAWGQERRLTISNVSMQTDGLGDPNAPPIQRMHFTVSNVGRDAIMIYTVEVAVCER
jgi:hypothetical protein